MSQQPVDTPAFEALGLSPSVLEAVTDLGYHDPSPVQAQAIPLVLAGRDVLAAAQTGTGKTAAFVLPVLDRLPHHRKRQGPFALVVTPTRELAQQIVDVCQTVGARTGHRTLAVVGGVSYNPQRAGLARGVDVLVATPGRLEDLIGSGDARLDQVQVLVLDEADRMLDMGFLPAIKRIVAACPAERQTLLFSATLDEGAIEGVADLVRDPERVEIARRGATADTIEQFALPVSSEAKNALLPAILQQEGHERVIVFCRTKHRADAVCRRLVKAGIKALPIHGNRNQRQRERALKSFREGRTDVLVATDVLARGIDVPDVDYVVNFDVPGDPEDYVHRIGRTGRAGEAGWALTFVTPDDLEDLLATEALMGRTVPAFERTEGLALGQNPPFLDPERVPARVTGAPASGKHRRSRTKAAATKAVRRQRASSAGAKGAKAAKGVKTARGPQAAKAAQAVQAAQDTQTSKGAQAPEGTKGGNAAQGAKGGKPAQGAKAGQDEKAARGAKAPKAPQAARDAKGAQRAKRTRGAQAKERRQDAPELVTKGERRGSGKAHEHAHRKDVPRPRSGKRAGGASPAGWQSYNGPRKQRPHNGGRRRPGDKGARTR